MPTKQYGENWSAHNEVVQRTDTKQQGGDPSKTLRGTKNYNSFILLPKELTQNKNGRGSLQQPNQPAAIAPRNYKYVLPKIKSNGTTTIPHCPNPTVNMEACKHGSV